MKNKYFEMSVGIFIILGVLCLIFLSYKISGSSLRKSFDTYTVQAQFKNIGSLRINAAVKIAGVEIGQVTKISLDKAYNGFLALVTMSMHNNNQKIPANYSASIAMSGILGDSYIALSPPKEDVTNLTYPMKNSNSNDNKYLHQGSKILLENTESSIDLSSLINTFIVNKDSSENNKMI